MNLHLQSFCDGDNTAPAAGEAAPEAEFEELIKGKYADAFKARVQGIIDKRFSKMKAMEKSLEAYAPLKARLEAQYPHISPDDTGALVSAYLEGDFSRKGKSVPDGLLAAAETLLKRKAAEGVRDRLLRDTAELRRLYPSFDLKGELSSSPEMCRLITAGVPLRRAYEAVNIEKITEEKISAAVLRARLETAEAIKRGTRVAENSLSDRAAAHRHTDVNKLTEADIRKIIQDVGNGARVTF